MLVYWTQWWLGSSMHGLSNILDKYIGITKINKNVKVYKSSILKRYNFKF